MVRFPTIKSSVAGSAAGAALLLVLAAGPAAAADGAAGPWNFGAAVMFSKYTLDDDTIDDDSVGGRINLGYRINKWFGVEGSWLDSGQLDGDLQPDDPGGELEVDVGGFMVDAVVYAPIASDDIAFFAKGGLYRFDQQLEEFGSDGAQTSSSSRIITGLTLGAGMRVNLSPRVDIRVDGDWFDLDGGDYWTLSLGADYRFGGSQ
jgi:opacity protein-like surface antigen